MNRPVLVVKDSFQEVWIDVGKILCVQGWNIHNLMVSIQKPELIDTMLHRQFNAFAEANDIIKPKDVAYTIFPQNLYEKSGSAARLFSRYNQERGMYAHLRNRPHRGWGTYFRRMTHYVTPDGIQNQLANIIDAIKERDRISKAAYTIVIEHPGGETIRPLGAPCLNYIAIQLDAESKKMGLLAVYRNHDFFERAYGNYWGLCNLLKFMANETNFNIGTLTCVSSHAYIDKNKRAFRSFIESLE
jgi:thymidylate synthase